MSNRFLCLLFLPLGVDIYILLHIKNTFLFALTALHRFFIEIVIQYMAVYEKEEEK